MVFEFRAVNMMFQDLRHHLLRKFVSFSHFCVEAVLAVLTVLSNSKRKAKMKVVGDMRCCLFWSLCNSFQIVIQTISIKSYYKVKMVDKLEYLDFCLIKCQILSIDNCFGCSDCYDKLVSFLLYWFRVSVPKYVSIINLKHYNFKFLVVDMVFLSMDVW